MLLGRESEELSKFGFKPQKRRKPMTSEQKALRAAKARLTRKKRNTMGARQKAELGKTETPSVTISPDGQMEIKPADGAPAPNPGPAK